MVAREMKNALKSFVAEHPDGWSHAEWDTLLSRLGETGLDVSDPDSIGLELERSRVLTVLEGTALSGLGPKRRAAIAERYPRMYDLRQASEEELAEVPSITPRIARALRSVLA